MGKEILIFVLGGILSALFFLWRSRDRVKASLLLDKQKELNQLQQELAQKNTVLEMLQNAHRQELNTERAHASERLALEQSNAEAARQEAAKTFQTQLELERKSFETERQALHRAHELLLQQFEATQTAMGKDFETRTALLREEFKNLSEKLLTEKAGTLQNTNKAQLETLLAPLKEKMGEFKSAVEESKSKSIELNSALKTELRKMMEVTEKIGSEANHLAIALKGDNKTQGNWGEMILEEILKRSGLQRGIHYECQETLRNADGETIQNDEQNKMRPDVIVYYPDGKAVVIDSKVSLSAYTDYINATNEDARKKFLTDHLRSVKNHVNELARKNYSAYLKENGRNEALDFVVMFIPHEAPHQLAMQTEPNLWRDAFQKHVLIVSPVNLMALLQMIHLAWTRADQERNQQKILDTAALLLERLYAFYEQFDDVGKKLDSLRDSYLRSIDRMRGSGKHNIIQPGEQLKRLGVKMRKSKPLPERFRDAADPELEEEKKDQLLETAPAESNDSLPLCPRAKLSAQTALSRGKKLIF